MRSRRRGPAFERANIYVEQGNEEAAIADCKAGLEVDSNDRDLNWLLAELEKPANKRFKGRFAQPPRAVK